MKEEKIGILGGTFDPVHVSHLELAAAAQREFFLSKILFIPSAVPPHKKDISVTAFQHRVKMLDIACGVSASFECNAIEGTLPKPSYTIDTLKALLPEINRSSKLFFIIGCDAFLDILTWKSYREILRLVNLIVAKREGTDESKLINLASNLAINLTYNVSSDYLWLGSKGYKDIHFLNHIPAHLSSTFIKKNIENKGILAGTLPQKVVEYINKNDLYIYRKHDIM